MRDPGWDEAKQRRLNGLRAREEAGVLTPAEQAELDGLLTMLDDLEWQQLQPALERMEQEQAATARGYCTSGSYTDELTRQRSKVGMVTASQREAIRRAYHFQCGYCNVHESDVGSVLEIDHFQPLVSGGTDEESNLVYACSADNKATGDFRSLPNTVHNCHTLCMPSCFAVPGRHYPFVYTRGG